MAGHARAGVDLQQVGQAATGINHHVGTSPAAATQAVKGTQHQLLNGGFLTVGQPGRHQVELQRQGARGEDAAPESEPERPVRMPCADQGMEV